LDPVLHYLDVVCTQCIGPGVELLIDGRVIAAYSRGQIVLPKSNKLEETRRSRGVLSYSIKGELFGHDYRQFEVYIHIIQFFSEHTCLFWSFLHFVKLIDQLKSIIN
jgi:hypothetical protein